MKDMTLRGEFPMARFSGVHANGIEETRAIFRRLVRDHEILTFGNARCHAEIHYAPLQSMALSSVSLNTPITARVNAVNHSALIFALLEGDIRITIDGQRFNVLSDQIVAVPAGSPFSLDIPDWNRTILLEIDQEHLDSLLLEATGGIRPDLMQLNQNREATETKCRVAGLLRFLRSELDGASPLLRSPRYVDRFEDLIASSLAIALPVARQDAGIRSKRASVPRYVRRTVEYIYAHPDSAPTLQTLSRIAATSSRTLIRGFNRHLGQSPIAYLRNIRLQRAHEDLCRSRPEESSVTEIAHKWNFSHLGRFTALYRSRFGRSPADSLRSRNS